MEKINILFLIIQVIILFIQVGYERYSNQITIMQKRVIFKICVNNMRPDPFNTKYIRNYDLSIPVPFKNIGDDSGRLMHCEIMVNDNLTHISETRMTLASNGEFDELYLDFNLNKLDLESQSLNVKLTLKLANSMNYHYTQIINMNFLRRERNNIVDWELNKYDWEMKNETCKQYIERHIKELHFFNRKQK